ncbi:MAG: hypothetical protein JOY96_05690 [Verrucomicrobia bacterium]|nr:hypothetical protein [Verrucomicrobiota bacterium]MBV9672288.1 hypothetical protein [Verrucomicrobiota bacterium]
MITRRQILTFLWATLSGGLTLCAQSFDESASNSSHHTRDRTLSAIPTEPGQSLAAGRFSWHEQIVTTVFWIGETPSGNNPVPNRSSAWDLNWARNFGGSDSPDRRFRADFIPSRFMPRQNPFYLALPYNDVCGGRTKPEASKVIPWFKESFAQSGHSVLKDRWVAVRRSNRVCYAQWEDVGPFRSDHWEYVFGTDRPRANLNCGAGLDVSPAIRDYLGMSNTDVTDWRFVELSEVPPGPWTLYGENNTFVIERRKQERAFAKKQ